jgi:hypothetical protein
MIKQKNLLSFKPCNTRNDYIRRRACCKTKLTSKSFFQTPEDRGMMLNLRIGGGGAAESADHLIEQAS